MEFICARQAGTEREMRAKERDGGREGLPRNDRSVMADFIVVMRVLHHLKLSRQ